MAGSCGSVDLWRWAREVDVVSNDHYLTAADDRNQVNLALSADLTRSVAGGRPWILMEHSTSAVNWQPRNIAKAPGEMARNALAHLGRGADGIMFFQWRASPSGAEKFHSAMLPHAGTSSRVWREVCALGRDLGRFDEVRGSVVQADVAILWDWQSFWAQDLEWRPSADLDHRERIDAFYDRLWRDNVTVDFAHPDADLSRYRLVVAPASYLLTARSAANLTRFVMSGGTLLVSYFSAVVDEHDAVHPGGYGAPLREVLGLGIEDFLPLRSGARVRLSDARPRVDGAADGRFDTVTGDVWCDDLVLDGAETVATFADGPAAGKPAVTRHGFGAGAAWYVSTRLDVEALATLLAPVYADAGLAPRTDLPDDVELVRRHGHSADYVVALNHGDHPARIRLAGVDLLTGEDTGTSMQIPAGGVRVIRTA
jgi:beta-galactosidase